MGSTYELAASAACSLSPYWESLPRQWQTSRTAWSSAGQSASGTRGSNAYPNLGKIAQDRSSTLGAGQPQQTYSLKLLR